MPTPRTSCAPSARKPVSHPSPSARKRPDRSSLRYNEPHELLRRDPVPQAADHVLHHERLPAVGKLASVSAGDGIGRWTEFAQEGECGVGPGAFLPGTDAVFPPL